MAFYNTLLLAVFSIQLFSHTVDGIFLMPPYIFQTSTRAPTNNSVGSFTSNISFGAITNTSNVVVAVSQNMGRSAFSFDNDTFTRFVNTSIFMFKDGNWTSFRLRRRRRSLFDLGSTITKQVFTGVSSYMNQTAAKYDSNWIGDILNNTQNATSRMLRTFDAPNLLSAGFQDFIEQYSGKNNIIPREILNSLNRLSLERAESVAKVRSEMEKLVGISNATSSLSKDFLEIIKTYFQDLPEDATACLSTTSPTMFATFGDTGRALNECVERKLVDGLAIGAKAIKLLQSTIDLPASISLQSINCLQIPSSKKYYVLLRGICLAKIPVELARFSITTASDSAQTANDVREYFANIQMDMINCGASGMTKAVQSIQNWENDYENCLANAE